MLETVQVDRRPGFLDEEGHTARFVKRYADLATIIREALAAFVADIRSGAYPEERHTYGMPADELAAFEASFEGPSA